LKIDLVKNKPFIPLIFNMLFKYLTFSSELILNSKGKLKLINEDIFRFENETFNTILKLVHLIHLKFGNNDIINIYIEKYFYNQKKKDPFYENLIRIWTNILKKDILIDTFNYNISETDIMNESKHVDFSNVSWSMFEVIKKSIMIYYKETNEFFKISETFKDLIILTINKSYNFLLKNIKEKNKYEENNDDYKRIAIFLNKELIKFVKDIFGYVDNKNYIKIIIELFKQYLIFEKENEEDTEKNMEFYEILKINILTLEFNFFEIFFDNHDILMKILKIDEEKIIINHIEDVIIKTLIYNEKNNIEYTYLKDGVIGYLYNLLIVLDNEKINNFEIFNKNENNNNENIENKNEN
jgi:hypothetical protein